MLRGLRAAAAGHRGVSRRSFAAAASTAGRPVPGVVKWLIGGAVVANAGLIAWTWRDKARRQAALDRFLSGPLSDAGGAALPDRLAVEKLVVLTRGAWPVGGVPLEACEAGLAAETEAAAADADTRAAAGRALTALAAGSPDGASVTRIALLVAASLSARCEHETAGQSDAFAVEAVRAGLVFRALEGGRGVPATREALEAAVASLPVGEHFPVAVVRAAEGRSAGLSGGKPSDEVSLSHFEAEPTTALMLRAALTAGPMCAAVAVRPLAEQWLGEGDRAAAEGLVLAMRAVVRASGAERGSAQSERQ